MRGLRVSLQSQSHVEGDIYHQSLAIEQGAYFEGKSRRSDTPLADESASAGHGAAAQSSGNPFSSNAAE
ncbi:MAG: polymer-forming cytoskeletal protein [Methyloceanibacter sp.]